MRVLTIVLFVIYIAVLVKLVVLKGPLFYQVVSGTNEYKVQAENAENYGVNLIPFRTIRSFMTFHPSTSTETKVFNVLGNIALFIPMGFFLPIIFKGAKNFLRVLFASFLVSLCFEIFQLVTHTGHFDVDDLILNSIGGMIGYSCFIMGVKLWAGNNVTSQ